MNASHYQLNDHPLHQAIYDLCQQIEKCGASTELTKAVTMASGLQRGVAALREEVEKAKRMNRENYDAGNAYMEISTKVRGDCDTLRTQLTAAEARCKELEAALHSIARAPTFDINTQTIVDLARNTLTAARKRKD